MGWSTNWDFQEGVDHQFRGWGNHNLVGYMQSHDEEQLMTRNVLYGNSVGGYDTRDTATALLRMAQAAAFFFTVPGPKMIWQWEELGYDYPADPNCLTCIMPSGGPYLQDARRKELLNTYAALIKLKTENVAFQTEDYKMFTAGYDKRIHVTDTATISARVMGNFDVVPQNVPISFNSTGWWYDYMSGDSLNVINTNMTLSMQPGDWKIYLDTKLSVPGKDCPPEIVSGFDSPVASPLPVTAFPNPFSEEIVLEYSLPASGHVQVEVLNLWGQSVKVIAEEKQVAGLHQLRWDGKNEKGSPVANGLYFYAVSYNGKRVSGKMLKGK